MLKGFRNIGNSCFFNAVLQIMKIPMEDIGEINSDDIILCLMMEFYKGRQNDKVYMELYRTILTKLKIRFFEQHDSHEILQKMTDVIQTAANIFNVEWMKIKTCNRCKKVEYLRSKNDNNTNLISYELQQEDENERIRFDKFLGSMLKRENVRGMETACGCNDGSLRYVLVNMPKYLFLTVSRFKYDGRGSKLMNRLQIANNFSITTPVDIQKRTSIDNRYILRGLVLHHGRTLDSGHYTAMLKINDEWFMFDDSTVSRMTNIDIDAEQLQRSVYIMLYEKIS